MKTLYIECNMGAAGDMLMAALSELIDQPEAFIDQMNGLGLPGVRFNIQPAQKCGVTGTHIAVTVDGQEEHSHDLHGHDHDHPHDHSHDHPHDHPHDHDHHEHTSLHTPHSTLHTHSHLGDIRAIIGGLPLSERVKADATAVYELIAQAESEVHGQPVEHIHFHEVGTLDAVADVVGVCALMEAIAPDRVIVSPIHVGSGQVRCAHGVLPVPAPATARILAGAPIYGGAIRGELCTPTGAALLKHFAGAFGPMPPMTLRKTGYGMGTKDFEWANCVRVLLGEMADAPNDTVAELRCNLDDMTGEEIAFATETLLSAGALDVWTEPIQMKKGRPAALLSCLCPVERESEFAALLMKHTTTLGVRCQTLRRYTLDREAVTLDTPYGPVRGKRSHGYGVERVKPEFDDLAELARREGIALRDIKV
ncbi:MAG: nickel pincer cofactor biosynthesis protein LarC [Clostridia bacterium]|nr:nickel pincer cofactor biosynthesis protein LarC [Clostridia bacterium]